MHKLSRLSDPCRSLHILAANLPMLGCTNQARFARGVFIKPSISLSSGWTVAGAPARFISWRTASNFPDQACTLGGRRGHQSAKAVTPQIPLQHRPTGKVMTQPAQSRAVVRCFVHNKYALAWSGDPLLMSTGRRLYNSHFNQDGPSLGL